MEASVSENRMAARQQKTDANYLPVSAAEQNILWHLLCLSKEAIDVREVPVSRFWKEALYDLGLQIISYTVAKVTRWKIYSMLHRVATKLAILAQSGIILSYTVKPELLNELSENSCAACI